MAEEIKLSNRLRKVASYLPKGAHFADIGSDHAYLPCYVCSNDSTARAIAGEVNEGPLSSAIDTIKTYQLQDVIEARLGNGLAVLQQGEVNQVVIAGMGGALIRSILENGKDKLEKVNLIIAQPNVDEKNVRSWYMENGFIIEDEAILEENGHIYEIIVGQRSNNKETLSDQQLLFGPILLNRRDALFFKKWKSERDKLINVIRQMKQAKVQDTMKIGKFEEQLSWIEEVLRHEPDN
ncbi:tRNA (adenine(22)-N(1))-methyltransferase TrmK [Ornithinibacillus sp. BX22]|uniref:tRNA (Adenine(22)-N(1))-methyltransferase TrmK n=1 Tax=Ornithinibacillus hominis TaxID=2763055 RepID=A0A923L670_9BACI|nr:class I SAM-dependent methyltransferase [Ornithinibacillus hominis]MBC5637230.1 tRNA (adenine(22)-N(1))-methyltransferase TrmK [Ornithinibacillus hominis]